MARCRICDNHLYWVCNCESTVLHRLNTILGDMRSDVYQYVLDLEHLPSLEAKEAAAEAMFHMIRDTIKEMKDESE